MWGKIRTIAGTSIYITFTDLGALFFIIAMPVALSVVIGLAFGEQDNTIDLGTSELVIINQDETVTLDSVGDATARQVNWGNDMYSTVLIENVPEGLDDLIDAEYGTDIDEARQQVEDGERDAVLVIPPDFTTNVLDPDAQGIVDLYYNPGNEITATVLLGIVDQLTAQINTGQSAQFVLIEGDEPFLINTGVALGQSTTTITEAATATLSALYNQDTPQPVTLNSVNISGEEQSIDALQYFAPSMAILFMTFAMATGMRSILEENRTWTMQRLLTTPTPRWAYMAGKMLGTFGTGIIQMLLLILITSLVAMLMGRTASIWGTNYPGLALAIITTVGAASGLGLLLTAFSKDSRQADSISTAVLIVMAMLGGAFVPVAENEILNILSNFTLHKWGIESFFALSENASIIDILPNMLALTAMTVVFFGLSLFNFNRRTDI